MILPPGIDPRLLRWPADQHPIEANWESIKHLGVIYRKMGAMLSMLQRRNTICDIRQDALSQENEFQEKCPSENLKNKRPKLTGKMLSDENASRVEILIHLRFSRLLENCRFALRLKLFQEIKSHLLTFSGYRDPLLKGMEEPWSRSIRKHPRGRDSRSVTYESTEISWYSPAYNLPGRPRITRRSKINADYAKFFVNYFMIDWIPIDLELLGYQNWGRRNGFWRLNRWHDIFCNR
jgi:hypothetical protein